MCLKMMLRRMFNIKFTVLLLLINFFNDFVGLGNYNKIKEHVRAQEFLQLPFERFVCNQITVLSFAMYLSFTGCIVFSVINSVNSDNQKSGIFMLTRMSRKRYVVDKIVSVFIFVFLSCTLSIFQSFITHRIAHIVHPVSTYLNLVAVVTITLLCASFLGICVCSLLKEPRIAFLLSVIFFAGFSAIISSFEVKIPTLGNTDIIFIYPAVLIAVLVALFVSVTLRQDFITTKIKE